MVHTQARYPTIPIPDLRAETRTDWAAILAIELCLLDGLMTLPHWHLETNPVVLILGPTAMLTVKLMGVSVLLWLWFVRRDIRHSTVARGCVWLLCCLYTVVVVSNVMVLVA